MSKTKQVPVIVCIGGGDAYGRGETPYWAVTAFGRTKGYATEDKLESVLNFVYGVGKWFEADRRLADQMYDIPQQSLDLISGDVPEVFQFVRTLAETPWDEWKARALQATAARS